MIYVLILSSDNGATWRILDSSGDRDTILRECATWQAERPDVRYEVKSADEHLWSAVQNEGTHESFF